MTETLNSTRFCPTAMETFLSAACQQYVGTAMNVEREQMENIYDLEQ